MQQQESSLCAQSQIPSSSSGSSSPSSSSSSSSGFPGAAAAGHTAVSAESRNPLGIKEDRPEIREQHTHTKKEKEEIFQERNRQKLTPEWVHERTAKRIEYFELQQLSRLEKKERDAIRDHIGKEIRDNCRAELDDYYDCMVDRSLTFLACRSYAQILQRCVKRYEKPELIQKRWKEVAEERERLGVDGIRRHSRKQYNKYVTDADGTGWLPKRKSSSYEENSARPFPR